jgi:hypothetical protein
LQTLITANGGDFRRDLTKSVSHLVALKPEGQKYKFAKVWDVKVVSLKWFEDSLERGMILDESLYDPELPLQEQGVGAWNRSAPKIVERRAKPSAAGGQRPRKIRRVASAKLGDQTNGIWTDIVGIDKNAAATSDQATNATANGQPLRTQPRAVIQEAKSFASDTTLFDRPESMTQDTEILTLQTTQEHQQRGIWHASRFYIHGFTSSQVGHCPFPSDRSTNIETNLRRPKS